MQDEKRPFRNKNLVFRQTMEKDTFPASFCACSSKVSRTVHPQ
jgi:hypothetical protein